MSKQLDKKVLNFELAKKKVAYQRSELNKIKNQITKRDMLVEGIAEALSKKHVKFPKIPNPRVPNNKSVAILVNSDIHIGKQVDLPHNKYNHKIALKRQAKFIEESVKIAKRFGVEEWVVGDNGDIVEHNYMRKNQAVDVEFQFGEQIMKALDFRLNTIERLSNYASKISYFGTTGNHDRLQGDKDLITKNSSSVYLVNETLDKFYRDGEIKKVKATHESERFISFKVNGKHLRFEHGHETKKSTKSLRDDISKQYKVDYDLVCTGHYHSYNHKDGHVSCGSLVGVDDYSTKLGYNNTASQVLIIVTEDGDILPFRIELGGIK